MGDTRLGGSDGPKALLSFSHTYINSAHHPPCVCSSHAHIMMLHAHMLHIGRFVAFAVVAEFMGHNATTDWGLCHLRGGRSFAFAVWECLDVGLGSSMLLPLSIYSISLTYISVYSPPISCSTCRLLHCAPFCAGPPAGGNKMDKDGAQQSARTT